MVATVTEREYLTTAEAAELLRVSIKTLYNWHSLGTGPPARKIGKLLYRRDELNAWLDAPNGAA